MSGRGGLVAVDGVVVTEDEARLLRAFQRDHPGTEFARHGGERLAYVPFGSGGVTVGRDSWPDVLDALGEFFDSPPDGGGNPGNGLTSGGGKPGDPGG